MLFSHGQSSFSTYLMLRPELISLTAWRHEKAGTEKHVKVCCLDLLHIFAEYYVVLNARE